MNQKEIFAIVACGFILISSIGGIGFSGLQLSTTGYSSGFQNPRATFRAINWNGKKYDSASKGSASMAAFDTQLSFDADGFDTGKPNILGEETSVFIPSESLYSNFVPTDWIRKNAYIENPRETYAWNITSGNGTRMYKMEKYVLKWYVSFSAEWNDATDAYFGDDEIPLGNAWLPVNYGQSGRNAYTNAEVWFEFDLTPTWYIEGGGTAYFAIGDIMLSDIKKTADDNNKKEMDASSMLSGNPESAGSSLYVYSGLYGTSAAESDAYTYHGKKLNPDLFRDTMYAKYTLVNFGVDYWNEWGTIKAKGDVLTLGFDITVFMIGEWDVKDVKNIDFEDWTRTTKTTDTYSIVDWLSDPRNQALITAAIMAGAFILLLLFAPWVLIAIFSLFGGRRRRR